MDRSLAVATGALLILAVHAITLHLWLPTFGSTGPGANSPPSPPARLASVR